MRGIPLIPIFIAAHRDQPRITVARSENSDVTGKDKDGHR